MKQAETISRIRKIATDLRAPFGEDDYIPGTIEDALTALDALATDYKGYEDRHAAMRQLWQEARDEVERLNASNEALRDEVSRLNALLSSERAKS